MKQTRRCFSILEEAGEDPFAAFTQEQFCHNCHILTLAFLGEDIPGIDPEMKISEIKELYPCLHPNATPPVDAEYINSLEANNA